MNFRKDHTKLLRTIGSGVRIVEVMLLGVALTCLWGCRREYHAPEVEYSTLLPTAHIRQLAELLDEGLTRVPDGVVLAGVVSANDAEGNFYRSIVVEDASGAVEVSLGMWELAGVYPVGCGVTIDASGLAVVRTDGVLTLGWEVYDWSGGRVEPIAPREEIVGRVVVSHKGESPTPRTLTIGELTEQMCGRLVRLEGVRAIEPGEKWGATEYGTSVDRAFEDAEGRVVVVRTSRYADFAERRVPEGELSIDGILYRGRRAGEDVYVLKMRSIDDVKR